MTHSRSRQPALTDWRRLLADLTSTGARLLGCALLMRGKPPTGFRLKSKTYSRPAILLFTTPNRCWQFLNTKYCFRPDSAASLANTICLHLAKDRDGRLIALTIECENVSDVILTKLWRNGTPRTQPANDEATRPLSKKRSPLPAALPPTHSIADCFTAQHHRIRDQAFWCSKCHHDCAIVQSKRSFV